MSSCIQHGRTWRRRSLGIGGVGICAATVVAMLAPATSIAANQLPVTAPTCGTSTNTEYAQGTTAAAIGWAGNDQAVVGNREVVDQLAGFLVVK